MTQIGKFQNVGLWLFQETFVEGKNQKKYFLFLLSHFISTVCGDDIHKGSWFPVAFYEARMDKFISQNLLKLSSAADSRFAKTVKQQKC